MLNLLLVCERCVRIRKSSKSELFLTSVLLDAYWEFKKWNYNNFSFENQLQLQVLPSYDFHLLFPSEVSLEKRNRFFQTAINIVLSNFSLTYRILKIRCSLTKLCTQFYRNLKLQQYFLNKFVRVEAELLQRRILYPYLGMSSLCISCEIFSEQCK